MAAAGRRTSLASLAGQKVENVPGQSDLLLLALPLNKVVPTRFNPRRRFGTEDELRDFGTKLAKKQLQPAVVVSRTAYLKLWPEEAEHVGDTPYVIANGERRYRASLLVGRPTLDVVHNEGIANSRADFLDAVQSENNDRENLDPIERALGIDIMVTQLGDAIQVATYYGKTKGWVSQQRKLLKLAPALQDLVSTGELPVRVARDIAGLPEDAQPDAWEEHLERRRQEKEAAALLRARAASPPATPAPRILQAVPSPNPAPFTAVNQQSPAPDPAAPPPPTPDRFTAVNQMEPAVPSQPSPAPALAPEPVPSPVPEPGPEVTLQGRRLPYDDGPYVAHHLFHKMQPDPFIQSAHVMLELIKENLPDEYMKMIRALSEQALQES